MHVVQQHHPPPPQLYPKSVTMLSGIFYRHGRLCASHPWEVIVTFLTLTVCMISMGTVLTGTKICAWNPNCVLSQENKGIVVVVMTIMRCMALLYVYHQFRKLYKLGSKYLLGIAGLFTVFSSVVFSTSVLNLLDGNFTELNEALPFFLLLIDLSKAGLLAQFALSSGTQAEVRENIARGMSLLGPSITLDTLVETLVIGVGTLSGVKHLEEMCCFACMSALVNYIVFMTFFPACLSLILELSRDRRSAQQPSGPSAWQASLARILHLEQQQKANPVLQRVKVIMSAGLMAVHVHSRWPLLAPPSVSPVDGGSLLHGGEDVPRSVFLSTSASPWTQAILRWFAVGTDQIVMLVLACALAVKYIFFESHQELKDQLAVSSPSLQGSSMDVSTLTSSGAGEGGGGGGGTTLGVLHRMQHSQTSPDLAQHLSCCARARARFVLGGDSEESRELCSKGSQTESMLSVSSQEDDDSEDDSFLPSSPRTSQQCLEILNSQEEGMGPNCLSDEEIILLVEGGHLPSYKLEGALGDAQRGVSIRRALLCRQVRPLRDPTSEMLIKVPYRNYDYSPVLGACCENVIGYMPVPLGVAGPLLLDGEKYHVPMATTEGCLVASANRGCRALVLSGGVKSRIVADGMTRGPVVRMPSVEEAANVMCWLQRDENFELIKNVFDSTSRFARLKNLQVRIAGRLLFIRFVSITGDAMGMNMLSKGTEVSLTRLQEEFPSLEIISLSGNFCTDKKPAAINWLEGRGKSVVCAARVPAEVVRKVLKTNVSCLIEANICKNLVGSAMAGSVGGFNAQAANIVTAIYIATGQDPAQNVVSSNCITLVEACGETGDDLYISCTMPSIEVGTIGGGTVLPAQAACLELLGVRGPCMERPGENASRLARVVCGTVLAGELSLLSALAAGHLVKSHMKHNRSQAAINSGSSFMTN